MSRTETKTLQKASLVITLLALAVFVAAVTGCGRPGADGDAYIAYSWVVGPITIATNDPAFAGASYIYNGEFLRTSPGVYDFEYVAWDDSYWAGWYEIYVNPGEDGGIFSPGEDGTDLYFELACYSTGPSFYVWEDLAAAGMAPAGAAESKTPAPAATEPVAVLGAGLPEKTVAAPGAGAHRSAQPAAPGDASAPQGALGALGSPRPPADRAAGRRAAVTETVDLPGVTVVFGFWEKE